MKPLVRSLSSPPIFDFLLFSHSLFPVAVEAVMSGVLTAKLMPLAFNISPGLLESHGGSCPQALIRDQLILLKS